MVLKNADATAVRGLLAAGFNGGRWDGVGGIASSAAGPDPNRVTALGSVSNASQNTSSFAGVTGLTSTDVLVKYTYYGDGDLDGDVDGNDVGSWASNFTGSGGSTTKTWDQGDWDYDGDVDGNDVGLWASNFTGSGGGVLYVPDAQPGVVAMLEAMGFTVAPAAAPPTLTVDDVTVVEGNGGTRRIHFTVTRSGGDLSSDCSVTFQTADGTAKAGRDYAATRGTLTFAPGQTTAAVEVQVLGDRRVEPQESFSLVLSAPVGGALGKAVGVATITDDDGPRLVVSGRALKADTQRTFSGVVASFTDVDFPDPAAGGRFGVTVLWGDGGSAAGTVNYNAATRRWEVSAAHRFARKGKFNVSVRVSDANGATGSAICPMTVLT
jgi:hypothetical protein